MDNINDINDINNINNVTGDELNKILENINLIPDDIRKQIKIDKENKLYVKKLKDLERAVNYKDIRAAHFKKWKEENKELYNLKICTYIKEKYKNNEEFRKQKIKAHRDSYYMKKYGMTPEEYKIKKEEKLKEFLETNKEKIEKMKEKDKLKKITPITSEDATGSDKSNRDKINAAARHTYYMKKYNMSEQEYKKMKQEQYNNKIEKYKDKFNNLFIPSCVNAH